MYTDIANFLGASPEWVKNWLDMPMKAVTFEPAKLNPLLISEIADIILRHLCQLVEKDYWEVIEEYKVAGRELDRAYGRHQGTNPALRNALYKRRRDLADKKQDAFAYQVEIEKIILESGRAFDSEKKQFFYNRRMLSHGFDPYEIPTAEELENEDPWWNDGSSHVLEYWDDEDPDDISTQTEDTDLSEVE
jgi:hypothetical protein